MALSSVPAQFLRSAQAPPKRTLWDVLESVASTYPEAAAIDDGQVLTYAELMEEVTALADSIHAQGIRRGDRIGIRMPSGTRDLYIAILATLAAGAAYVPVDADDPEERAEMVFGEANINALFDATGFHMLRPTAGGDTRRPRLDDTAWIIFTSGSTGKPKGCGCVPPFSCGFRGCRSTNVPCRSPFRPPWPRRPSPCGIVCSL